MFKYRYSNVPIELVQYAQEHKMHKAFGLYLLMKASCDGNMELTAEHRSAFMELLEIKDVRSFTKHLKRLVQENWIGYDSKNFIYYLRSSKVLRKRYWYQNSAAVVFDITKDAPHTASFIYGALISYEIKRRSKARQAKIKKLAGSSALTKESALQELVASGKISEYIGLSLSSIGRLINVSKSQADRIKSKVENLGYISTKVKFKVVHEAEEPDFKLFRYLRGDRKYSVKKVLKKGKLLYQYRERSYDEMFSHMEFRNQKTAIRRLRNLGAFGDFIRVKGLECR